MKNYLSFGGGINSVALYLHLSEIKTDFEAIFIDHGGDWPETYEYIEYFSKKYPLTILKAQLHRKKENKTWYSIIDFCNDKERIPQQWPRWCTGDWKKDQINKYIDRPCTMFIGIDFGESHRAKISSAGSIEYRYPLIENEINRKDCIEIIKKNNLNIPPKSGCFICPFQSIAQIRRLRIKHPNLYCILDSLEKKSGRTLYKGRSVSSIINEKQLDLFNDPQYPPCLCAI